MGHHKSLLVSRVLGCKVGYIGSPFPQHTYFYAVANTSAATAHARLQMGRHTDRRSFPSFGAIFQRQCPDPFPYTCRPGQRVLFANFHVIPFVCSSYPGLYLTPEHLKRHFQHRIHFAHHHLNTTATFNLYLRRRTYTC
jgi:hypothetical protein